MTNLTKHEQDLGIKVVESWKDGRHVLTIVDVSGPQPALISNDRLLGLSALYHRRYGGEWVYDLQLNDMRRVS